MTIIRLVGGLSPGVGSDPRTFPAIFNEVADLVEANESGLSVVEGGVSALEGKNIPDFSVTAPSDEQVLRFDATLGVFVPEDLPNTGGILQVVSTTKTNDFSASIAQGGSEDITGLTVTITPISAFSKILVQGFVNTDIAATFNAGTYITVLRGSTPLAIGDAAGSRHLRTTGGGLNNSDFAHSNSAFTILDSPATTSAITYKISVSHNSGTFRTVFVNRATNDSDSAFTARTASSITVMEVAG